MASTMKQKGPTWFSRRERGKTMDTKTLVVGQEVWMGNGKYSRKGTVVEITEKYIAVGFSLPGSPPTPSWGGYVMAHQHILFDHNGVTGSYEDGLGCYLCGIVGEDAPWTVPGTECGGPWKLQER
jgi:hypothetical protein